ncbi:MAG: TIGR03118 family protein, partial [Gaiellaceae bacterium]
PSLPKNAVPFGIQDIKGKLLVAYCDASGGPGGVIDVFTEDGTFVKHFTSGAPLNQPWGMALAPGNFGPLSNTLLVSNNLDVVGDINGFDIRTGKFVGTVSTPDGKPILIDQIWGIEFGGGTAANGKKNNLYWAAGPVGNVDGAFGVIVPN